MGETEDTSNDLANVVTITNSLSSDEAGGDDESGTLRVHTDDFSLYNINVKNEVSLLGDSFYLDINQTIVWIRCTSHRTQRIRNERWILWLRFLQVRTTHA